LVLSYNKEKLKKWNRIRLIPKENININLNLGTVLLDVSMNRFFKLKTIKKIIEIRFLIEYNFCPIFVTEELSSWNY
jgi:hypothetical protein